jgi:hypothetical protein
MNSAVTGLPRQGLAGSGLEKEYHFIGRYKKLQKGVQKRS